MSEERPSMSEQQIHKALPVDGYRPQSSESVNLVNTNKQLEENILRLLDAYQDIAAQDESIDARWLAIGRTHIEQGFMAVNRAIFQPGRVALPGE